MPLTKLRQQGGAVVVTIPGEVAALMGWAVGTLLNVDARGGAVSLTPAKRVARGRRTVSELLEGIDELEIAEFNAAVEGDSADTPQGKERI